MEEYKKKTMMDYSANAEKLAERFAARFEEFHTLADPFINGLRGKKILDVGCGPGDYLNYFREQGLDALGIDLNDEFLQLCVEKGLNVRKMDLENPPLWPHSFDGIWAQASVLHVPKARIPALVDSWARLLKKDGLLWLSVKEGAKEGMEKSPESEVHERWVSYFSNEEISAFFSSKFVCEKEARTEAPGVVWLTFLFRLKPETKPAFRNF